MPSISAEIGNYKLFVTYVKGSRKKRARAQPPRVRKVSTKNMEFVVVKEDICCNLQRG